MHLNVVVFPAPFNPNNPKHSPGLIAKFKFFIATISFSCLLQQPLVYIFLKFFTLTANNSSFKSFVSSIVLEPSIFIKPFSDVVIISILFTLFISLITSESLISVSSLLSVDFLKE